MIGKRLGAFVRPDQVAEVWAGVTGLFRDYGYRRLRHRARIKFLVADWGPERFREVLEKEYLKRPLIDGPAPELPEKPVDLTCRSRFTPLRRSLASAFANSRVVARPDRGSCDH